MIMAVLTNNLTRSQNQNRLRAFTSQRTRVGASIKSAMMYGVKSTNVVKVYCNMQHADGCFFAKLIPWFIHWRDSSSDVLF